MRLRTLDFLSYPSHKLKQMGFPPSYLKLCSSNSFLEAIVSLISDTGQPQHIHICAFSETKLPHSVHSSSAILPPFTFLAVVPPTIILILYAEDTIFIIPSLFRFSMRPSGKKRHVHTRIAKSRYHSYRCCYAIFRSQIIFFHHHMHNKCTS